jgi:hypothetical protein
MEGLKDGRLEEMTRSFEQADGSVASRLLRSPQYVARKIAYNARLCLRDLGDIYVFPAVFWTLLGLTVLSFVHGWRAGAWLLLVWSLPALAYLPLSIEARYFCPLAMMLGLFSGEGCVRLREAMEGRGLARAFRIVMAAGAAFLLALMAMAALVSRSGDEPGVADAAAAVRRDMDGKLGETFVFDPQLRFAVDGRPMGERSAPLTEECCAGSYVIEPARDAAAQRARLAQVERRGVRFERKPTTGSVEIWERVDAER